MANCLAVCAVLPQGALADMIGQSVGCRLYHGGAPAAADPKTHCPHAGPAGEGTCGMNCDSFCTIAQAVCTGPNAVFADAASCLGACSSFPMAPQYTANVTSGDSFACRMYHLTAAATQPATHCIHIGKMSAPCQ